MTSKKKGILVTQPKEKDTKEDLKKKSERDVRAEKRAQQKESGVPNKKRTVSSSRLMEGKAIEPFCVTIADITAMKHGDELRVFCVDRNWEEQCTTSKNPQSLLDCTKTGHWRVFKRDEKSACGGLSIWSERYGTQEETNYSDTLHVEYAAGRWYPLEEESGMLPLPEKGTDTPSDGALCGIHWKNLPQKTRVGWRGSCISEANMQVLNKQYLVIHKVSWETYD
jgi:hypothetical protein